MALLRAFGMRYGGLLRRAFAALRRAEGKRKRGVFRRPVFRDRG